ncbi:MAG: hypothetical protein RL618_2319 [Pseudomonadota bacterium]|jgi:hypothetical protein
MSESGFHVHGPHDHEVEHAAHNGSTGMAVATALLATVGALFSYMGGYTQANAALFKNNAAIKKTEASNQWNYYQAKSSKQNLAELSLEHQHHRWAQATTAIQVSIALAAIALLTRRRGMELAMYGLAGFGVVLGVMAYLHL